VIAGADSWLAEQALETLLEAAVGADRGDSVQVFRGDETGWPRVVEAARTGSLFATRRAVVMRNADAARGEGEELIAYLDDPSPDAAVILLAAKPDKRKALWKKVLDRAQVTSAEPLKPAAIKARVRDEVRKRRLPMDESAVQELIDSVGQDLRRLMGELEKLEAFAEGHQGKLTADEVSAVLGRGLGQPLYRMSDAFAQRKPAVVLGQLETLLEEGEPALKLLGTLHRALRQVRGVRAMRESRAPQAAIASRLGILPFKVGDLLAASREWSEEDLKGAFAALDRADRLIKTSGDPGSALAVAVVEACSRKEPAVRPGTRTSR
jgi:DNA polymerase-3 subunit delta